MTDAHRLTPEDVAVLRRRVWRGWAGTVTFVVTLGLSIYAAVSATETWLTGWASAIAYLGLRLGLGALALAYVAPRSAAVCGLVWSLYLVGCAGRRAPTASSPPVHDPPQWQVRARSSSLSFRDMDCWSARSNGRSCARGPYPITHSRFLLPTTCCVRTCDDLG